MRRNHAEYPAAKDKTAIRHDDLMMIYSEGDDKPPEAVYADSEGHVIHYESEVSSDGTESGRSKPGAAGRTCSPPHIPQDGQRHVGGAVRSSAARQAGCVCALLELGRHSEKKIGRRDTSGCLAGRDLPHGLQQSRDRQGADAQGFRSDLVALPSAAAATAAVAAIPATTAATATP